MKAPNIEQLQSLTRDLRICFRYDPPKGNRDGKKRVTRLVERFYDCSPQRARRIVNRLEQHGYMYVTKRHSGTRWHFDPNPLIRS